MHLQHLHDLLYRHTKCYSAHNTDIGLQTFSISYLIVIFVQQFYFFVFHTTTWFISYSVVLCSLIQGIW